MKHRIGAALSLLAVGACSIINSPETLQTGGANTGATANNTAGKSNPTAGSQGDAGNDMGTGGTTMMGTGGCGVDCEEGGAPPLGRACDVSAADCGSTAPICDAVDGECRPCASDPECSTELQLPFCLTAGAQTGRCAECKDNTGCMATTPICSAVGVCRACAAHDECESGVCNSTGSCAIESQTVYALAQTGSTTATCGTLADPCRFVATASMKLTAQRPNLVLLKTSASFENGTASLPAVKGLRVIGNGVTVPSSGASVFRVPAGAAVTFEDMVLEGAIDENEAGIECVSGEITVLNSTLRDNGMGVFATDCDVTVTGSIIEHNANPLQYGGAGINAGCSTDSCAKRTLITRSRFIDNGVAIYNYGQEEATIENNLFLRNGFAGYTRVMELRAARTRFAYNTLVENFNSCTYVGIVACIGECDSVGNISYNSFPNEAEVCYDQVWYGTIPTYSLTEITQPGASNKIGEPLFVDPTNGDYTPGVGSPARDAGNPADSPNVDINGNPRPVGDAPDMGAFEAQ